MEYIFLDLDGTITNPKVGITKSIQYALSFSGIQIDDLDSLCKHIGPPLIDSFMEYEGFNLEKAKEARVKYRERFEVIGWLENEVYDGMEEALKTLKEQGKKLVVATSKPEYMAKRILDHFELSQYFIGIYGSVDGGRSEKGEVIEHALHALDITDRSKVLMVGDTKYDMIGAKEAKIHSLGVLYGFGLKSELLKAGAERVVETVEEMVIQCILSI